MGVCCQHHVAKRVNVVWGSRRPTGQREQHQALLRVPFGRVAKSIDCEDADGDEHKAAPSGSYKTMQARSKVVFDGEFSNV